MQQTGERSRTISGDGLLRPYPEVSQFLSCSRDHVFKLMREGRLAYVTIGMNGTERRIPMSALRDFVERNTVSAGNDTPKSKEAADMRGVAA